jgi:hypothetical protein
MRQKGRALLSALALLGATAACGGPEKTVVDQYFNAVRQKDNQTLSSFAAVNFDKPVQSWKITKAHEEEKGEIALPALVAKVQELEKAVADNLKAARTLDPVLVEQVREARRKGQAVPAKLAAVAGDWDKYNEQDRQLKRQLAVARDAVEKEKRNMRLSVGDQANLDGLQGEMVTKKVELDLSIDGQSQPYVMTLRKYEVKSDSGPAPRGRWVVQSLQQG